MPKYCPENERVKRDYAFYLEAANGKQNATVDAALRAIERFEVSTNHVAVPEVPRRAGTFLPGFAPRRGNGTRTASR